MYHGHYYCVTHLLYITYICDKLVRNQLMLNMKAFYTIYINEKSKKPGAKKSILLDFEKKIKEKFVPKITTMAIINIKI